MKYKDHLVENPDLFCYFRGRNFRGQKVLREQQIAKLRAQTFANDAFFRKFSDKNFRDPEKSAFSREKLSRLKKNEGKNAIFYSIFFSVLR